MERPPSVGYSSTEPLGTRAYSHVEIIRQAPLEMHTDIHLASDNPKTEIAIEWQAEKDLVGRAERGYNGCATKHTH